ncbi:DoxX family protein [Beijerinckia indica subsp. indica ATCC 9039]|uniref:DoxX family protein n=2 Tax=Beijerinckia TaxID=532 RepID=B2IBJ3_BEII9|nr:DoxX family protein [Beijerinckia indica subsp. indica ATCC 9039]
MYTFPTFAQNMLLLTGRILLALLFVLMGWSKINDFNGTVAYMLHTGAPFPPLAASIAIITELGVGLAIVFGVLTRPLALILAVYTIATGLIGHNFWTMEGMVRYDNMLHFYKNISIAGGLLSLAAAGAGLFSVDTLIEKWLKTRSSHQL